MKRSQDAAVACRALYRRAEPPQESGETQACLSELGYRCERIGSTVRIELPLLLPKRGCDCSFLMNPLSELLSLHVREVPKLTECTVAFQHIYGSGKPSDIRDHDNVETRAVLNVIERYLLTSDSRYYCANVQMTQFGACDKTIIWLFPSKLKLDEAKRAVG